MYFEFDVHLNDFNAKDDPSKKLILRNKKAINNTESFIIIKISVFNLVFIC